MTIDEDTLREILTSAAPRFDGLDGAAVRAGAGASGRASRRHLRWPRAVPAIAAAVLVAGVALGATLLARTTPSEPSHPGINTATASFRLQIQLGISTVPANGKPIRAYVLAINNTGRPIEIRAGSCDEWVQAGLSGNHVRFGVSSLDVACGSDQLQEGVTRIPVTILTTYTGCQQGKQPGTAEMPHCIGPHDSQLPPLPPGDYEVELGTQNVTPAPALPVPARITLTPVR